MNGNKDVLNYVNGNKDVIEFRCSLKKDVIISSASLPVIYRKTGKRSNVTTVEWPWRSDDYAHLG